jgi:type III pantothenate kinase
MILCLDVGNTQIYGGIFKNDELVLQFRKTSQQNYSSDEIGIFLKSVIKENNFNTEEIRAISICSVVPDKEHSIRSGCYKYFNVTPFFLQPGVKTGLKIKYNNPLEVGADRIANAVAAIKMYQNQNIIIVDFGTANTFCVISKNKEYLGGLILPGIRISMEALEQHTAKLPRVEIKESKNIYGKTTVESIQAGLYHGHIAIVSELTKKITAQAFQGETPVIIGTGGFSSLFQNENLFDTISQTLVLKGLLEAYKMNENNK